MDYTITPAKPRSIVRRLAPWTAALGLFAGGGYGVHHYAASLSGGAGAMASTATDAANTETPTDRLLAATSGGGAQSEPLPRYTTPFDPPASRYATAPPALPPAPDDDEVTTPRSAESVEPPVNPFAAPSVDPFASRYAPVLPSEEPEDNVTESLAVTPRGVAVESAPNADTSTASEPSPSDSPAQAASADFAAADVTRGQEPSANPLRSGSRAPGAMAPVGFAAESVVDDETASAAPAAPAASDAQSASGFNAADAMLPPYAARPTQAIGSPSAADDPTTPTGAGFVTLHEEPTGSTGSFDPHAAAEPAAANPADAASPLQQSIATPLRATASEAAETLPSYAAAPSAADSARMAIAAPTPTLAEVAAPYDAPLAAATSPTRTPGFDAVAGAGRPGELTLEGVQSPALTLQKLAPVEIQVGKPCMFQVRVQNASQRTIHNVQVIDEVPLGTQLIGTAPKALVASGKLTWDLGTLSPGEERIVEMELMPVDEGEIGSVATVSFASQASVKTRSTKPQLELRLSSAPRVMIGEAQIVQIELMNPGSGDATGVMLLANIPEGVTHEAGPALEFEVGTLRAGETKRLDLALTAAAAGLIDNIMTARADANLQVQANCQFEVIAPELKLSVAGPAKRILERPATFKMSVDNPGTASARDVQLVTQLPPGLKFVSANNHGEYDAATHSVYWSLPELPANEHGDVELTALAVEPGDHTLQVATRAQQGLEDRAETQLSVEGIVALAFEVQDVEDAIEVGGETAYEIRVLNQGTKTATNVQVIAKMPAGLRAQMVQGEARYAIDGDQVVFAPLPQLAPKAEATFRFGVQGLGAGDQRVTLELTTDEVREPIVEVESTQVYADE